MMTSKFSSSKSSYSAKSVSSSKSACSSKNAFSKNERGQSLVELALSMSFMLILLAGVMDFGRAFFTYIALRDAAQEGALYASYSPLDCDWILQRIHETSNTPVDLSSVTSTVTINGAPCSTTATGLVAGQPVVVTLTQGFHLATPFLGSVLGTQAFTLTASIRNSILVNPDN
jgi:Flp pilus assembly protein TadG